MEETVIACIVLILCWTLIGIGISAIIESNYKTDIMIASMLLWPIIVLIVTIFEFIKFVRKLFNF